MQDFHLENIIKEIYSVITMIHWQQPSVFTSAEVNLGLREISLGG